MTAPTPPAPLARPYSWRVAALALVPLALFLGFLLIGLRRGLPVVWRIDWIPSLGVDLSLHIDGLSLLFLLLITGIGAAVLAYTSAYMAGQPGRGRLVALLVAFMGTMIGCVTADNLVTLLVFWELTSVVSFLLVGFKYEDDGARRAARQALFTTVAGGVALLAGILMIGAIAGTYSLRALAAGAPGLLSHPLIPVALGCLVAGAFTKSAQWPFHFWLPNAMAAPTPVSAYLHSATMVKLGVYLLARLKPVFGSLPMWEVTLVTAGAATAAWAMVLALRERDLKRILAWSTVSALGTLVLLIGLPGAGAAEATGAFLLAHALYKAPLFFVAGNVDRGMGTRSIDHLAGLARVMPWTALAAALGALSMAGVPLSFGFVAKDLMAVAKAEGQAFDWASYATLFVSAVTVAVAGVAAVRVFWHRGRARLPEEIREASWPMLLAPLALAALGIALGIAPGLARPVLDAAAMSMMPAGDAGLIGLGRDHFASLGSTAVVFAFGAVIFAGWDRLHGWVDRLRWADPFGPRAWYRRLLEIVPIVAGGVTSRLQHGHVPGYLAALLAFTSAAVGAAIVLSPVLPVPAWSPPPVPVAGAALLIIAASVAVCLIRNPFVLLLTSGLCGMGSAIICLFAGAPDVAFTQFTVEVAFVVVVAAVILRVRRLRLPEAVVERRAPRAVLAMATGTMAAVLLLTASAGPFEDAAPRYFGERSLTDAFGRNVTNVILVDFRALDTLGEITVLALTLAAALPLLGRLRSAGTGTRGSS